MKVHGYILLDESFFDSSSNRRVGILKNHLAFLEQGIKEVKSFTVFLPTSYNNETIFQPTSFKTRGKLTGENIFELDKFGLFLEALHTFLRPGEESHGSDLEAGNDAGPSIDLPPGMMFGDLFGGMLEKYAIFYIEGIKSYSNKDYAISVPSSKLGYYEDVITVAKMTPASSNLEYLIKKRFSDEPKYYLFDTVINEKTNLTLLQKYVGQTSDLNIQNLFSWSKNGPPAPTVVYNKSENLLVTYSVSLAFISLATYNVWRLYKTKRDLIREMMRGPNKLILNNQDLEFQAIEGDLKKEASSKRAKKGAGSSIDNDGNLGTDKPPLGKKESPAALGNEPGSKRQIKSGTKKRKGKKKGNIAKLVDELVWVKKIPKFELKKQTHVSLKNLRELRHDNLNRFCGFYDEVSTSGLIFNYCQRGSLFDLLKKQEYNLDWTFKSSLMLDLVRGMNYLHKSNNLKFHGKLKSTNCVVDSRFTLKVTDYGVPSIKAAQKMEFIDDREENAKSDDLLWTAPEILR